MRLHIHNLEETDDIEIEMIRYVESFVRRRKFLSDMPLTMEGLF